MMIKSKQTSIRSQVELKFRYWAAMTARWGYHLLRRRPAQQTSHVAQSSSSQPAGTIAVLGGGMAAHRFCRQLAAAGGLQQYHLMVFTEEPTAPYDRVKLTDFFRTRDPNDLLLDTPDWYANQEIDLRLRTSVTKIDPIEQYLYTDSGTNVHYDTLVLATGSHPLVPPIDGIRQADVFEYRTIADLQAILHRSQTARRAAVIGGGLLGLEAARALLDLGLDTTVVEIADYLMPRQLDLEAAELLLKEIETSGVKVLLGRQTQQIQNKHSGLQLCFRDHPTLTVDFVVVSAGIIPRGELAMDAGLTCTSRGAAIVNDHLQTSDPKIYAIGECAAHRGHVYGLAAPAYEMADTVVDNLMGKSTTFTGADLSTRLKLLGVDVSVFGDYLQPTDTRVYRSSGTYRKLALENGRLIGALAVGAWPQLGQLQSAVQDERRLDKRQLNQFIDEGDLWTEAEQPVSMWPDDRLVCNCFKVSKGTLVAAYRAGATSAQELASTTRASTLCGSCRPLVLELSNTVEHLAEPIEQTSGALKWVAIAAMIAVALLMLLPPLPITDSIQHGWHDIEALRRDPTVKQITGYTLLGLAVAALGLSLRKRWQRVSFGAFRSWRLAHTILGLGTLVGLVAHTGLRFGSHLNFALMTVFITLNLVGAFAGWVTALEAQGSGRISAWARQQRPLVTFLHILLFWPLPVLLAFHILAAYYY